MTLSRFFKKALISDKRPMVFYLCIDSNQCCGLHLRYPSY